MTERAKKLLLLYYKQSRKIRRVSGLPPLTFKAKKAGTLKDYRIYGNTAGGESVGDRTGNLFDGSFIHRSVIGTEVSDNDPNRRSIVIDISNFNNGNKITFSRETSAGNNFQMYQVTSPLKGGILLNNNVVVGEPNTLLAAITLDDIANYHYLMIFLNGATNPITDEELLASKIMVNVGNTPLPYEPYRYKVPVTVEGKNLFDENYFIQTNLIPQSLDQILPDPYTISTIIPCNPNTKYTISKIVTNRFFIWGCTDYPTLGNYCNSRIASGSDSSSLTFTTGNDDNYLLIMLFYQRQPTDPTIEDVKGSLMFNYGEALPYEPYHAPVTTTIYLPEQIKKVGDEAEYISYADQKLHRVGADDIDVTLPELPVLPGTNTLTVGTEVQPSYVEISGRIKAAGGD